MRHAIVVGAILLVVAGAIVALRTVPNARPGVQTPLVPQGTRPVDEPVPPADAVPDPGRPRDATASSDTKANEEAAKQRQAAEAARRDLDLAAKLDQRLTGDATGTGLQILARLMSDFGVTVEVDPAARPLLDGANASFASGTSGKVVLQYMAEFAGLQLEIKDGRVRLIPK